MLNYIAIGIPISMWLSSTMTVNFPCGFSMDMHGYSVAHLSAYHEARWDCGPSAERKETCDENCSQSVLWNTTQIGAHGLIDKQVQMLRSYFVPRKTTIWYRKGGVLPAYSTWLCITVLELYFHQNLAVLALFYLE